MADHTGNACGGFLFLALSNRDETLRAQWCDDLGERSGGGVRSRGDVFWQASLGDIERSDCAASLAWGWVVFKRDGTSTQTESKPSFAE